MITECLLSFNLYINRIKLTVQESLPTPAQDRRHGTTIDRPPHRRTANSFLSTTRCRTSISSSSFFSHTNHQHMNIDQGNSCPTTTDEATPPFTPSPSHHHQPILTNVSHRQTNGLRPTNARPTNVIDLPTPSTNANTIDRPMINRQN